MARRLSSEDQLKYVLGFYDDFLVWKEKKHQMLANITPQQQALIKCVDCEFRPFVNHVVKLKTPVGKDEREAYANRAKKAIEVGLNSFYMPADMLELDFLSDSGTSAMTTKQWGQLLDGDESYGSNEGWKVFNETIAQVFGSRFASVFLGLSSSTELNEKYKYKKNFNFITNQGRGAENCIFPALAECLIKCDTNRIKGKKEVTYLMLCSNNFFDTTSGHILNIRDKYVLDLNNEAHHVTFSIHNHPNPKVRAGTYSINDQYLGNGDFDELEAHIKNAEKEGTRVGIVFTTITNNSGGSQPVSLEYMERVYKLCKEYNIPHFLDACRFAENAYMIKTIEAKKGTPIGALSVQEIVHKQFELCDGFTISFKKDGIANCGGGICFSPFSKAFDNLISQPSFCLLQMIYDSIILQVGHITYGSLTGRDIKGICEGLKTVVREDYLRGRVHQVAAFASVLRDLGVPILAPTGTSAIYLDMDRFMDDTGPEKKKRAEYYGNSIVGLCLCAGIRVCELGASAFSSPHGNAPYKTPEAVSGNFVRLAIPRQLYSDTDLYKAALWLSFLYENRKNIKPVLDRPNLRQLSLHHFKMMFDFKA